ncbi:MAG: Ribonuclease R [Chlamydiae bacterium]|nr:Ribonuclease R [Chlamydiota bacterium]
MTKESSKKKLFKNLLTVTEQFMLGRNFVPLTRTELMQKLYLPKEHRDVFKEVLKALVEKKVTRFSRGRYYPKKFKLDVVIGALKLHPRGFGFVSPDDPSLSSQDIFIPKRFTQNAVDGDSVEVEINPFSGSDKGPEGRVITILKRGRTHLAGIVSAINQYGHTLAYVPMLGAEQRVVLQTTEEIPVHVGDRVVMEVIDWGLKDTETVCRVSHHLGHISDPSCDISAAIEEFDLRNDFPTAVIREAQNFGSQVSRKEIQARDDLRDLECITIDPDTARDFDDALSLTKDNKGNYHLGVHIADVSHYVLPGTPIDEEAKMRCNSTYFPGFCLPMLPPILSESLCSLRPNTNRLSLSILMRLDHHGEVIDYKICRAVIKSKKRFTYKQAKQVLDGEIKSPHKKTLELMVELCHHLKQKRYERGSIEFALPELAVIVDKDSTPIKTDYVIYDITHQLVEEFMLKANEIVALHLSKIGKDLTYRVHEEPSEESMKDFVMIAHAFGFKLPDTPTSQDLQALFEEAQETPYGSFLATNYIRRMRMALYTPENIGHYGLGLSHYCHFTSPIRRYIDLVIHRILLGNEMEYEHLEEIAQLCSEQERISERAERNVTLLKKLRLLDKWAKETPFKQFDAVITRVRNFGIYFEILDLMIEGFLHLSDLEDDFYEFDNKKTTLHGRHTGTTLFAGEKITVMLKNIDLIMLETQWKLVSERKERIKRGKNKKRRGAETQRKK